MVVKQLTIFVLMKDFLPSSVVCVTFSVSERYPFFISMIQKCNAQIKTFFVSVCSYWPLDGVQSLTFKSLNFVHWHFTSSHLVAKLISNASGTTKWHDPVAKFLTNASGAIWWLQLELIQVLVANFATS